tara:strand:- start:1223 stop:1453 length:231 start_codon:yes stop_codon:yes gene_type:complete
MELSWQQFRNQNHIRILNENQQIRQYRFYLDAYANQITRQNKGAKKQPRVTISDFLLQENLSHILQEDSSGIYISI